MFYLTMCRAGFVKSQSLICNEGMFFWDLSVSNHAVGLFRDLLVSTAYVCGPTSSPLEPFYKYMLPCAFIFILHSLYFDYLSNMCVSLPLKFQRFFS